MQEFIKNNNLVKTFFSNSLFRNASNLMVGSAVTSLVGFIFVIVATRLYTAEAVGLSTTAISSIGLISLISELGLGITIIRFLFDSGNKSNELLNFCLTISCIASILLTIIFVSGLSIWSPALIAIRQNVAFVAVYVVFAIGSSIQPLLFNTFLARRITKYIVMVSLIVGLVKILLVVVFSIFWESAFGIFVGAGIATITGIVLSLYYLVPKVQRGFLPFPRIRSANFKEIFTYSAGNYIGRILLQLPPMIIPLIILNILGPELSAIFYVVWAIASLILVVPSAIFNSLFAEASSNPDSMRSNIINSLKFMFAISVPIILIVELFAGKILLAFGQSYSIEGSSLLRIFALSSIPWGINYLYISIARFKKQTGGIIKLAGLSTFLSLLISFVLITRVGLIGSGIGCLAGQSVSSIIVLFILKKEFVNKNIVAYS